MNGSLLLVSALIGTVNYASVFTLPGGFDSNRDSRDSGRPALYGTGKERDLLLFLWFTGVALYAAFLSLVEMVVIQLSKFASSDFFTALPFSHSAALTWTPQSLPELRRILTDQPDILTQRDAQGNTILHFLAAGGNATAFRELFEGGLLRRSNRGGDGGELRTRNWSGDTVLHEAARLGRLHVVEVITEREIELVSERNALGETPLFSAAANGEEEVFNLLIVAAAHDRELLRRDDGCTVLHAAIMGEHYSLAMEIVDSFPHLAGAHNEDGNTALNMLASKPGSFKSGSNYWLRNLGSRPSVTLQFLLCLVYLCMPMWINESKLTEDVEDPQRNKPFLCQSIGSFVENIISAVPWVSWLRAVHDVKKKHACALKLAKTLIANEEDWSHYTNSCGRYIDYDDDDDQPIITTRRNPLLQAAENSVLELVKEILGKFPEAAYCFDSNGKNIFHIAVENKDCTMYSFLKKNVARKDWMMAALDHDQNSILHLATKDGSHPRVLFGSLNRMAWNVYWFKLVCFDSPPHLLWEPNSGGKTATELFEDTHSSRQKDAENALKSMNEGMFVVSALFCAVNYATVFTVPGGFDTNRDSPWGSGLPVLYGTVKERQLLLFLFYTGAALLAALLSLVEMVAIQMSKFTSSDFFIALPYRYTATITMLYVALVSTTAACCEAYDIVDIFDIRIRNFFVMMPTIVAITIVYVDVVYLPLCGLCLALRCSLTYRGHMFEASAIFKRSFEEAARDTDQKKQEKEKVVRD